MLPFADLASLVFILALVTPFVRRNIQLAGYDVYYEPKTLLSREYFVENLRKCVDMAAKKLVMLSIETMDDPFINSLDKVTYYKSQVRSPWLQAYPDVGNLTAWPTNDVGAQDRIQHRQHCRRAPQGHQAGGRDLERRVQTGALR